MISMVVSMTACAGGGDASTTTAKTQAKTEAASQKTESEGKETQPSTTAAAQSSATGGGTLTIPEDVEMLIANRAKGAPDEVLAFYDSWSAKEMKDGKKPGEGFTVAVKEPVICIMILRCLVSGERLNIWKKWAVM